MMFKEKKIKHLHKQTLDYLIQKVPTQINAYYKETPEYKTTIPIQILQTKLLKTKDKLDMIHNLMTKV